MVRLERSSGRRTGLAGVVDDVFARLDQRSRDILDFEREWWTLGGTKEAGIEHRFGISATRYYQLLGRIVEDDTALAYDPMLVKRLRRQRARRRRRRAARRLGFDGNG